jgi:flagellar biosynthesis protein FlhF
MDVKTFEAFSMKEAVQAVKSEFGHDAVILRTSERPGENGTGKVYEVMAAPSGFSSRSGAATAKGQGDVNLSKEDLVQWNRSLAELGKKVSEFEEVAVKREHLDSLESGLFEIRSLLSEALSRKKGSLYQGLPEPLTDLVQHLQLMEIDDTQLLSLVKYLKGLPQSALEGSTELYQAYQAHAMKWMMKRIKIAPLWNPVMGERQLQVLVGPTGVGKSTSVAKLAARFHLKENKNVVVLSFDNQRLGAIEQMRIFAKVIGVPFETVNRLEDCAKLIDKHQDKDLILLDTAGYSPKAQRAIQDLARFKDISIAVNYHLVLSVTDRKSQIERTIKGFNPLGLQSLIFTKLDESWAFGEVFNASLKWGIPLSYFGIGQAVPEDLERASRERVLERIFGL